MNGPAEPLMGRVGAGAMSIAERFAVDAKSDRNAMSVTATLGMSDSAPKTAKSR